MMFKPPLWLYGAAMSLEGMRRGFIGGSALSLFIIKEFGLDKQAVPTLDALQGYLNIEGWLITQIPPFLSFLVTPWRDYHNAAKIYLRILEILAELQRPLTCERYWK
jgi:hypothetical protein